MALKISQSSIKQTCKVYWWVSRGTEVTRRLLAISAIALLNAAPALADQVKYTADLTASAETPPTDSTGTGTVDATYDTDTKTLTWTVT